MSCLHFALVLEWRMNVGRIVGVDVSPEAMR